MRKEEGFTFIELLIVLAILGILVGVVAMSVGGLTDSAVAASRDAEFQTVQAAIDRYNSQDVAADGAAVIAARAAAASIADGDGDAPFAKYLKDTTEYPYTWGAGGKNLRISE